VPSAPTAMQPFELRWTVRNAGNWPASGTRVDRFSLSTDAQAGGDALLVESSRNEVIAPGAEASFSTLATAPLPQVGQRWIVAALDATDVVRETVAGNANNVSVTPSAITIGAPALPDLAVDAISAPPSAEATVPFVVQYRVRNLGTLATAVPFFEEILLAAEGSKAPAEVVKQTLQTAIVPAGGEIIRTASVVLPLERVGTRRLIVRIDPTNSITEFPIDDANNATTAAGLLEVVAPPQPNLTVAILETPSAGAPGTLRTVRWRVTNSGAAPTAGAWVDRVFASADAEIGADTQLGEVGASAPLAPGASVERSLQVSVPPISDGYRIVVTLDARLQLAEESELDNSAIAQTVSEVLLPDLSITSVVAPTEATAESPMTVSWTARNVGVESAQGTWFDAVYLSLDDTIGAGDRLVASRSRSGPLAASGTYAGSATFLVPPDLSGPMRVLVVADTASNVLEPVAGESPAANSRAADSITLIAQPDRPDLVVTTATIPGSGAVGAGLSLNYKVKNQGDASANGTWVDRIVARNSTTLAETQLGMIVVSATVGAGDTYTRTVQSNQPLEAGTYQLVIATDQLSTVLEDGTDGETNNAWTSAASWTVGTFTVTAATDFESGPAPQTVLIGGRATLASGEPVPGVPIRVQVGLRGT